MSWCGHALATGPVHLIPPGSAVVSCCGPGDVTRSFVGPLSLVRHQVLGHTEAKDNTNLKCKQRLFTLKCKQRLFTLVCLMSNIRHPCDLI